MWRFVVCSIQSLILHMEDKIKSYLKDPKNNPRPKGDQEPHFAFLITYIGELFVQGYRLIEIYDGILLFCYMQFQYSEKIYLEKRIPKIPPRFKLVSWQLSSKKIFESGKERRELFCCMLNIGSFLDEVEYNIIYLRESKYSVVPSSWLQKNSLPECYQYFQKIQWIEQKNGCRPIMQKEQGIQMHRLVQCFLKGAGQARSSHLIKKIQGQNKFVYDLFKVVNTVCYIIGKQILENDFQTMSIEKWMRKFTQKKFKRFDLLMRSEQKCCIVDWKFTRLDAEQKIKGAGVRKKNQAYYQLAKKDFKTNIELRFYCLHERQINKNYHSFTSSQFAYQIETVDIQKYQTSSPLDIFANQDVFIIDDDMLDRIPDAPHQSPSDQISVQSRQTPINFMIPDVTQNLNQEEFILKNSKEHQSKKKQQEIKKAILKNLVIELESEEEVLQEQKKQMTQSQESPRTSPKEMSNPQIKIKNDFLLEQLFTNKKRLKDDKLKSKMQISHQILSD